MPSNSSLPNSGPGEHSLHHDRDVDHQHEIDPGQREHRDQRVLERVLADHQRLGQALEPCQLHIFRAQHFKHRRSRQAHMRGGEVPAEREGRHDQVQRSARARRWQPAQIHREHQDQHQSDKERRQRQTEQGEQLPGAVPEPAHAHRGEDAGRDADQQRKCHGHRSQQQRVRQAVHVEFQHRRLVVERLAEIATREVRHEQPVLHP